MDEVDEVGKFHQFPTLHGDGTKTTGSKSMAIESIHCIEAKFPHILHVHDDYIDYTAVRTLKRMSDKSSRASTL